MTSYDLQLDVLIAWEKNLDVIRFDCVLGCFYYLPLKIAILIRNQKLTTCSIESKSDKACFSLDFN